jgi:hypothetical protein
VGLVIRKVLTNALLSAGVHSASRQDAVPRVRLILLVVDASLQANVFWHQGCGYTVGA